MKILTLLMVLITTWGATAYAAGFNSTAANHWKQSQQNIVSAGLDHKSVEWQRQIKDPTDINWENVRWGVHSAKQVLHFQNQKDRPSDKIYYVASKRSTKHDLLGLVSWNENWQAWKKNARNTHVVWHFANLPKTTQAEYPIASSV